MTFDHAQSPRLGQKVPPENPGILMVTGAQLPEVAYPGQMFYRIDTQELQVYNGSQYESVVGGVVDQLTFVQPDEPTGANVNDLWYDSDANYALWVFDGTAWQPLLVSAAQIMDGAVTRDKLELSAVNAARLSSELTLTSKIILGNLDANGQVTGSYMVLDQHGAQLFDATGQPVVTMSTQDEIVPSFTGEVMATNLRVLGGLILEDTGNQIAVGGELELASIVKPPSTAPQLETYYEEVQFYTSNPPYSPHPSSADDLGSFNFDPFKIEFLSWDSTVGKWAVGTQVTEISVQGTRVWYFNESGTLYTDPAAGVPLILDYANKTNMTGYGRTTVGATQRVYAYWNLTSGDYRCAVRCPDGQYRTNRIPAAVVTDSADRPFFGYDAAAGQYLFGYSDNVGGNDNFKMARLSAVNTAGGTMTWSGSWYTTDDGTGRNSKTIGLVYGGQTGSPNRLTIAVAAGTQSVVFSTTGAEVPAEMWPFPVGGMVGFCHDGTNWAAVTSSGRLYKFSDWGATSSATIAMNSSYSWANLATGHETSRQHPIAPFYVVKRSSVRVTIPPAPGGGGAEPPDQWKFYAIDGAYSEGGSPDMWLQQTGSSATASSFVLSGLLTSGTHPVSASTFTGGTPAVIESGTSDAKGPLTIISGDGTGRWEYIQPAGAVILWGGSNQATPPPGWLFCEGQILTRTAYPYLFQAIGTYYNQGGETSAQFSMPVFATQLGLKRIMKT